MEPVDVETSRPKRGQRFTHDSFADPNWKPTDGQRWADAPKAVMEITRVTSETVWYGYAEHDDGTGGFRMSRGQFLERYGKHIPR